TKRLPALRLALTAPVDEILLALLHEALQLLFELWIAVARPARSFRRPVGSRLLDREVDLPTVLDTDHLDRDLVVLAKVLGNVLHEVPVDLGDVHEPSLAGIELYERAVRREPDDRSLYDCSYFCWHVPDLAPFESFRRDAG